MARWIQHPETGKLIPAEEYVRPSPKTANIINDIKPFVSPIDGSVISTRPALEAHNKRHGVTNIADYSGQYFEQKAKERTAEIMQTSDKCKKERINTIIGAIERLNRV